MMSASEKLQFDYVSYSAFRRYWNYFLVYNWFSALAETTGSFVLFIGLQAFFSSESKSLGPGAIGLLALVTLVALGAFALANRRTAKKGIEQYLLQLLPPPFFLEKYRYLCPETSGNISFAKRESALQGLRKTAGEMAWMSLLAYGLWGLVIGVAFFDASNLAPFLWVMLACLVTGAILARLYYLRLSQIDFVPLLSLEWGDPSREGLPLDENHLYRQLSIINRKKLRLIPRSSLYNFSVRHARCKLRIAGRITHGLLSYGRSLEGCEGGVGFPPLFARRLDRSVGVREVHALWGATVSIIISMVFFYAVTYGGETIGLKSNLNPFAVSVVMGSFVAFLYLPQLFKFVSMSYGHDSGSRFERATAEAFGLISEQDSDNEFYSAEGKFDEKTGLLRYGIFYREVIHVLLQVARGMSRSPALDEEFAILSSYDDSVVAPLKDFSLVLFDIDNFKTFNSIFGYLVADHLLHVVASVIREAAVENGGKAGRYGGEEFCVLLPGVGSGNAAMFAEVVRLRIFDEVFVARSEGGSVRVVRRVKGQGDTVFWSSAGAEYSDDLDPDEKYPNLERARVELEKCERELEGTEADREIRGSAVQIYPSLESEKMPALRVLVGPGLKAGVVWRTTVSAGVGGAVDLSAALRRLHIGEEEVFRLNYVGLFRRVFGRINARVDAAKNRGRNNVVGPRRPEAQDLDVDGQEGV